MRTRRGRWVGPRLLLPAVVLLIGSVVASAAAAGSPSGVSAEIRLGYDGYIVANAWLPLSVRLRSAEELTGTVEVVTSQTRPAGTSRVRLDVHLLAATPLPLEIPAVVRDLHAPVVVRLRRQDTVIGEWRVTVSPLRVVEGVVLALSRRPVGLQQILGDRAGLRVAYITERDLPARWQLYEGVRALVVRDFDERRLVPAQADALREWVAAGGRLLLAAPTPNLPGGDILPPLLTGPSQPPAVPGAPERVHEWGRGRVVVVRADPFRTSLPADEAAVWTRLLADARSPGFVNRSLRDVLPQSPATSVGLQAAVVVLLGLYLVLLRPLVRAPLRGRLGWLLAAALIVGFTVLGATLNLAVRRDVAPAVQAAVTLGLPEQRLALVESVGQVQPTRRGGFDLRASGETLMRSDDGGGETTLTLDHTARFGGTTTGPLPLQASAVVPLTLRGFYRERPQGIEVQIDNPSGRTLRDPVVVRNGQIQTLHPAVNGRAILSPLRWRAAPEVDAARSVSARIQAWTFNRLRGDAILSPTIHLVAWLDDDRGVPLWRNQPSAPVLLVLPLTQAEAAP
jgi:hypothetical protein